MIFILYIKMCIRDRCTAEELTQETFYQAVRSAHKYDGTCKLSTWLCQIAKHLWYQELDKRKRKGTSMLEESMVSHKAGPEDELCIREEKMDVFKKVHILDENAKEVMLLRITGAFSFKEIGEIFGKKMCIRDRDNHCGSRKEQDGGRACHRSVILCRRLFPQSAGE